MNIFPFHDQFYCTYMSTIVKVQTMQGRRDQLNLCPPSYAKGGVYYNDKISRLNIHPSLPYVEESYIFTALSFLF